jgi:hypothetical protein
MGLARIGGCFYEDSDAVAYHTGCDAVAFLEVPLDPTSHKPGHASRRIVHGVA